MRTKERLTFTFLLINAVRELHGFSTQGFKEADGRFLFLSYVETVRPPPEPLGRRRNRHEAPRPGFFILHLLVY